MKVLNPERELSRGEDCEGRTETEQNKIGKDDIFWTQESSFWTF